MMGNDMLSGESPAFWTPGQIACDKRNVRLVTNLPPPSKFV